MSSVFDWQAASTVQAQAQVASKRPSLAPKTFHTHSKAVVSDASLEALITQTNREVEHHFAQAQAVTDDVMRGYHRDESRRLAAKVRELVASRSPEFVAHVELDRGIA